jgi:YD repeat-containing protein
VNRILHRQKQLATVFLVLFIVGTYLPLSVASAQALFSRPGAGVSRLPLNVLAFDSPDYGTVSDAINLANGNVFLSMSDLSRNNVVTTGQDETTNSIGGSLWQLSSRLRLEGFSRTLTPAQVPATFFLGSGDGSGSYFKRVEKNTLTFSELPTWIARYETVTNAYLYRLAPQNSLQYSQEWIVLLPAATATANNAVAHYYTADGTRNTFYSDGEYLDYIQDIYQQYRSASSFDSEGINSPAKTQIFYSPASSGRISKIQDEYGRVTTYQWTLPTTSGADGDATTLDRIVYLVVAPVAPATSSSYARVIDFTYETTTINATPIQRIKNVKFWTNDGFSSSSSFIRNVAFTYTANNFIETITRKSADANIPELTTTYEYDSERPNRIKSVQRNDSTPKTTYSYVETTNATTGALQNFTVTVAQDADNNATTKEKETTYLYNSLSQLIRKGIYDSQLGGVGGYLYTYYYYYPTGSTKSVIYPSGMTEIYSYDEKGNLTEIRTLSSHPYGSTTTTPAIAVTIPNAPTTPVQSSQPLQLTANVANDRLGSGVYWQALKPGTTEPLGYITQKGMFFPPDQNTTVTIKATSIADPSKVAQATVTVKSVGLTVAASKTSLAVNDKLQLNATLTNDLTYMTPESFNTGVTWSTTVGTIDQNGLFTAPSTVTAAVITATSKSDPKKSQSVKVTTYPPRIAEAPILFSVNSQQTFVAEGIPGGVNWYTPYYSVSLEGLYTAPVFSQDQPAWVRATDRSNGSLSYYDYFTLKADGVKITNAPSASLSANQTFQFTADIKDPLGVLWYTPYGSITADGLYTAPVLSQDQQVWIRATARSNGGLASYVYFTVKADGVKITNSPSAAVSAGSTFQFTADIKDPYGVYWYTPYGSVSNDGLYTAPVVSNDQLVWVRATAKSNGSMTSYIYFTVKSDGVKITNAPSAAVSAGSTFRFTADIKDPVGVNWYTPYGSVSADGLGLYTAPVVSQDQQVWVRATALSNSSLASYVYFTVKADGVKITNAPTTVLSANQTFQFTADIKDPLGVNWYTPYGSIRADGFYTAPVVSQDQQVWVRATALSNSSLASYVYFTIKGPTTTLTISPPASFTGLVSSASTQQFTAGEAVNWSLTPWSPGSINASGLYTASIVYENSQPCVLATSIANPGMTAQQCFTVIPDAVTITNAPSAALSGNATFQFNAQIKDPAGITWKVQSTTTSNPATEYGTISNTGLYKAPIATYDHVTYVEAVSNSNPGVSKRIYFTVLADAVKISNAPSASMSSNSTFDFDALVKDPLGVTWKVRVNEPNTPVDYYGTVDANGFYKAPLFGSDNYVWVTATSKTNPNLSNTVYFTVKGDAVEISNAPVAALDSSATFNFTANTKDTTGVVWEVVSPNSGTFTGAKYTAPNVTTDQVIWIRAYPKSLYTQGNLGIYKDLWFTVRAIRTNISQAPTIINPGVIYPLATIVEYDALKQGVTWSLAPVAPSTSSNLGTIASGLYTAPVVTEDSKITVTATSKTNPSKVSSQSFMVRAIKVVLQKIPGNTVQSGQSYKLDATAIFDAKLRGFTYTSSLGANTISADGTLVAPHVTNDTPVTLTATSIADPTKSDSITITIKPPSADPVVPVDQGNPGAFAEVMTDPSLSTGEFVRKQTFAYDRDNRLVLETFVGADGDSYTYQPVSQQHTLEPYSTVTVAGQIFTAPRKVTHQTLVGSQALADTYWFEKYNLNGFITESVRRSKSQVSTTQYTYHDGSNVALFYPKKSDGTLNTTSRFVKQYADLVKNVTVVGLSSVDYTYDELGNVVKEEQTNAFVRAWQKSDAGEFSRQERNRVVYRSFNGFNQRVWERVQEEAPNLTTLTASVSLFDFYATGELKGNWQGRASNLTTYTYVKDAGGLGLGQVQKITQLHSTQTFTYDNFGRVKTRMQDDATDFITDYTYDSLDRVVLEVMPKQGTSTARGEVRTSYDRTGVIKSTTLVDPLATHGATSITTTNTTIDSLGRVTQVTYPSSLTVLTQYDSFDRPIKVTDNRLTMNAAGDDRASLFVYDSLGNLIKEVGPVLRSTAVTSGYTDLRRPYAEYKYDLLNRPIETSRLLASASVVSITNPTMPSDGTVAVSKTAYDAFDRVITQTDPAGYTTTHAYDARGNLIKTFKQVWKGGESDYSSLQSYGPSLTSYAAYDAVGRVTAQVDGRGGSQVRRYDPLGNVLAQKDERGVVTHLYGYTNDGLLQCVAEPDTSGSSAVDNLEATITVAPTSCGAPTGYVISKLYAYGTRTLPVTMYVASNTAGASSGLPKTSYSYDYAGRTLSTTLPLANGAADTITQSYDTRGNLLNLKDANGFVTEYLYDAYNRVTQEKKLARTDTSADGLSDVDVAAGLGSGLTTKYTYDVMGNLSKQVVGDPDSLITEYFYNSLGKVIAETRPYLAAASSKPRKLRLYQLDCNLTAETTYDYNDGGQLRGGQTPTISPSTLPSLSAGNITLYSYDTRGLVSGETSYGWNTTGTSSTAVTEHTKTYTYNGLGQRVKRTFVGWGGMYAYARESNGRLTSSPSYTSYWKYDQNGNLLESYDTLPSGASKQNSYSYTYTPTNKEDVQSRDVKIAVEAPRGQDSNSPFAPDRATSGIYVGYSGGSVNSDYNQRDLLSQTVVSESNAANFFGSGDTTVTTTSYTYGKDSSKVRIDISENGVTTYKTFNYDVRGRETSVADGNALSSFIVEQNAYNTNSGSLSNTVTTYEAGGKVSQRTTSTQGGDCTSFTIPTVGGLTQSSGTCKARTAGTYTKNFSYNQRGDATGSTGEGGTQTYAYSAYNQLESVTISGSQTITSYDPSYNSNGDIISEINYGKGTSTYTLDSRGNRLQVTGGEFNGHSKRYDADGRVREFHRYSEENRWILGVKVKTQYIFFSYDPFGNQVISVKAQLEENTTDSRHHVIDRQQSTSISSGGNVQVIRYQDVFYGTFCTLGFCEGANEKENVIRDESYSLIDSFYNDNYYKTTGSIVAPFDVIEEGTQPLEAPVEALSTTLQIDPMDIVAPSEATPTTPGESIEDITPPADAEATTEPEATDSTEGVATASTGITTLMTGEALTATSDTGTNPVTNEAVPIGSDLANGSPANPVVNSDATVPGQTDTLSALTSALPESITSVSSQDIAAPETTSTTIFTAPSEPTVAETTPDEVVSPDANIAPPQVGATAQDGPLDVVMPEELTASVPSVGSDVPAPIETVIPPVGWTPEDEDIDAFISQDDLCAAHPNDKNCQGTGATTLDGQAGKDKHATDAATGGGMPPQSNLPDLSGVELPVVAGISESDVETFYKFTLAQIAASMSKDSLNPDELVIALKGIAESIANNEIAPQAIQTVADMANGKLEGGRMFVLLNGTSANNFGHTAFALITPEGGLLGSVNGLNWFARTGVRPNEVHEYSPFYFRDGIDITKIDMSHYTNMSGQTYDGIWDNTLTGNDNLVETFTSDLFSWAYDNGYTRIFSKDVQNYDLEAARLESYGTLEAPYDVSSIILDRNCAEATSDVLEAFANDSQNDVRDYANILRPFLDPRPQSWSENLKNKDGWTEIPIFTNEGDLRPND